MSGRTGESNAEALAWVGVAIAYGIVGLARCARRSGAWVLHWVSDELRLVAHLVHDDDRRIRNGP